MNWTLAWEWARWSVAELGGSMRTLAKTAAVWAAVAAIAVGMFVLGHIEGSHGKRELRAAVHDAKADRDRLSVELGKEKAAVKAALVRAADAEKKAEDAAARAAGPAVVKTPSRPAAVRKPAPAPETAGFSWPWNTK